MKILIPAALVVLLIMFSILIERPVTRMPLRIEVVGLGNHGLRLETPADVMRTPYTPFDTFIINDSDNAIVAYRVVFDGVRNDGSTQRRTISWVCPQALMTTEKEARLNTLARTPGAILPHSKWLIGMGRDGVRLDASNAPAIVAIEHQSFPDLPLYKHIKVSFDGVLLDDGVFLGPDTSNFRDQLRDQAQALSLKGDEDE